MLPKIFFMSYFCEKVNISMNNSFSLNFRGSTRPQDVRRKQLLKPEESQKAILITNLPKKAESLHQELHDFISTCIGPVKLITFNKVTFKESASVSAICVFEDRAHSVEAQEKLHGQLFCNNHLLVRSFKDSKFDTHHTSRNSICVTNLPLKAKEEDLWKLFESCGNFGMIHINRNSFTGAPLEAIVNFKEADAVDDALKLDGSQMMDSTIKVVRLNRQFSLLVSNLNRQTTYEEFKDFFQDCNLAYFCFGPKQKKEQKTAVIFLQVNITHKMTLNCCLYLD